MYFAIISTDYANVSEKRASTRTEHLARLEVLKQENRLLLAGPTPISDDANEKIMSGSIVIAQFSSLVFAQKWAEEDPYCYAGVYEKVLVRPFKQVLP